MRKKTSRLVDALIGVGYVLAAGAFLVGAMMAYNRTFVSSVDVKLETGTIGNALQKGSDVKLHGVPVGKVAEIRAADTGATLTLALDPETSKKLSPDTAARLLPKTLFGERYVALITPADASAGGLSAGDTISQDDSDEAVELEDVFDELLPLLQSIQPDKLAATLGELSTMLRGQGADIGDTLVQWGDYLQKLNPHVPTMTEDIAKLGSVATSYSNAAPDLLGALDSMTTTAGTMVDKRTLLKDLYASVITSSDTTNGWVDENQDTIDILAGDSRAALEAAAPYAKQFPCLFRAAREFIPVMDKTLGKDTDEPGLHVQLNVVAARGKYLPGKDAPQFATGGEARCPYVTGQTGTQPASDTDLGGTGEPAAIPAPPSAFVREQLAAGAGLGDANSPAENAFLAELLAPTQGMAPAEYPRWSSLLVGPTLRDTKVTLR